MANSLDYNLLQTFVLLYKHRNLKAVGRALGVTESAVSKHLAKLREQLDDPLFVRDAQGFEPTSFSEQVIPTLTDGLNTIQAALAKDSIDCEHYTDDITVAILPIMHLQFGAELLLKLKETFPQATISVITYDSNTSQDIVNGSVDLGINYFNPTLTKSIYQAYIKKVKHAVVMSSRLTGYNDEEILKLPFIGLKARGRNDIKSLHEEVQNRVGYSLDLYAHVDNFNTMLNMVDKVDSFSIVQAITLHDDRFILRELPERFKVADNLSLVGGVKASNKSNPLHLLLLKIIKQKLDKYAVF